MKERAFFRTIAAIAITLVAIGMVGGGWLLSQAPWELWQGGTTATPQAAQFVPRQAPVMASLLVNPERLSTWRQSWSAPGQRRRAATEIRQFEQRLLGGFGLDYARDVQPWLGEELTWAVTTADLDQDGTNGQQPGYFVALAIADPELAQANLERFWQAQAAAGTDLVFERYAGIEFIHNQADRQTATPRNPFRRQALPPMASATLGSQFVLVANDPKVLREALGNLQAPQLSLAVNDRYQAALATLPTYRLGVAYAQLPALSQWLGQSIFASVAVPASTGATSPNIDRLLASLTAQREGLNLTTLWLAPDGTAIAPPSNADEPDGITAALNRTVAPSVETGAIPAMAAITATAEAAETDTTTATADIVDAIMATVERTETVDTPAAPLLAMVDDRVDAVVPDADITAADITAADITTIAAATPTQPISALSYIPADSTLVLTGNDLAQTWANLQVGWRGYGTVTTLLQQPWQWLATAWNLDIPAQVFPGVTQDYALGLTNAPAAASVDWLFVAQNLGMTRSATATPLTVEQLDDLAAQAGFSLGQIELYGHPVTLWTRLSTARRAPQESPELQAITVGAHTTIGDYTLIASSLSRLEASLAAATATGHEPAPLQTAIAHFSQPNQGYVYVDWTAFEPWLQQRSPLVNLLDTILQPVTQHLDTVTLTSYGATPAGQRGEAYLTVVN